MRAKAETIARATKRMSNHSMILFSRSLTPPTGASSFFGGDFQGFDLGGHALAKKLIRLSGKLSISDTFLAAFDVAIKTRIFVAHELT
jgi:hypothetical protein